VVTLYGMLLFLHRRGHRSERKGPPEGPRGTRRGLSEVGLLMRRIQLGVLADLVILTAIVFVMTTKPTL
jgi:hypothetical protein